MSTQWENKEILKNHYLHVIFDHLDSRGLTAIPIAPDALRPAPSFSSREAARVTSRKRVAAGETWRTSGAIGRALCTQRRLGEHKIFDNRKNMDIFENPVLGLAVLTHHCCSSPTATASAPGLLRPPPTLSSREGVRAARTWLLAAGETWRTPEPTGGALQSRY